MDNIIKELVNRNYLIPLEDIKSRNYYKNKEADMGWVKWGIWKLYSKTIGSIFDQKDTNTDSVILVSAAALKVILIINLVSLQEADI